MLEKIVVMIFSANGCDEGYDEALQNRLRNNSDDDDDESNDAEEVYIMPSC
jgi:hypothetical protein